MNNKLNSNVDDVINFMSGHFQTRNLNPNNVISNSWCRSILDHGLEPSQKDARAILTSAEVHDQILDVEDFCHIAKEGAQNLAQQLTGAGYAVILTNNEGVTLHSCCHPSSKSTWDDLGITTGAVWKESLSGTSAISTVLIEAAPLTVHLKEHFMINNIPLSCSACPIFDSQGNILAILDASCKNSKHSKDEQQVVLQLVTIYARWIENTYLKYLHKKNHIISIKPNLHFHENGMENLLVVNDRKVIIGANKVAIDNYKLKGDKKLVGSLLTDIITTNFESLFAQPITIGTTTFNNDEVQISIESPAKNKALKASTSKAIQSKSHIANNAPKHPTLARLTGHDENLIPNVQRLVKVIGKGIPILITGETGSGKEAFARAIHDSSDRASAPFIAVNCASIPESLIESELFGYRSGSFTGANKQGMKGKIELANGGTLFLDEIGDMPVLLQTRLLRVLAEKEVMPIGAHEPVNLDINIISATHQNITELVQNHHFREDLYYRLNGMSLQLPALRERTDREYIIRLIIDNESDSTIDINRAALKVLSQYHWPGNIRQLINTIRYASAMCDNGVIDTDCLPAEVSHVSFNNSKVQPQLIIQPPKVSAPMSEDYSMEHTQPFTESHFSEASQPLAESHPIESEQGLPQSRSPDSTQLSPKAVSHEGSSHVDLDNIDPAQPSTVKERRDRRKALTLLDSLKRNKWNITNTANDLGTCRSTIYRQMSKYNIDQPNCLF